MFPEVGDDVHWVQEDIRLVPLSPPPVLPTSFVPSLFPYICLRFLLTSTCLPYLFPNFRLTSHTSSPHPLPPPSRPVTFQS